MAKTIVSRPPRRASIRDQIDVQRGRPFQAQAIVRVVRFANSSELAGFEETDLMFSLEVADELMNDACAALELVGTGRAGLPKKRSEPDAD